MIFKIIFALIGCSLGGFLGGVLGWFLGGFLHRLIFPFYARFYARFQLTHSEFIHSLLIFTMAVVKSDNGRLMLSELSYIRDYLLQNFGPEDTQNALSELRTMLDDPNINLEKECDFFKNKSTNNDRLIILYFLLGLAFSDNNASEEEVNMIKNIAFKIGIEENEYESIKAMYFARHKNYYNPYEQYSSNENYQQSTYQRPTYDLSNDYKILEINANATDDEIKKAYRKQAMKHHPDKVSHLGEDVRKAAEEKFQQLNEAYERIKNARGIK